MKLGKAIQIASNFLHPLQVLENVFFLTLIVLQCDHHIFLEHLGISNS
jgi:hypothetical protein